MHALHLLLRLLGPDGSREHDRAGLHSETGFHVRHARSRIPGQQQPLRHEHLLHSLVPHELVGSVWHAVDAADADGPERPRHRLHGAAQRGPAGRNRRRLGMPRALPDRHRRRRLLDLVYRNGSLWTSHAVAGGTGDAYSRVRYVRFGVGGGAPTVLEDVSFGADGCWYYYPAVAPDQNSNLGMVFTRSCTNEYAGVRYTGRATTDTTLQGSTLLKRRDELRQSRVGKEPLGRLQRRGGGPCPIPRSSGSLESMPRAPSTTGGHGPARSPSRAPAPGRAWRARTCSA